MKNKSKIIMLISMLCLIISTTEAQYSGQVDYSASQLLFNQSDGYDIVKLQGCYDETDAGKPLLPVRNLHIALPSDKQVSSIEIVQIVQEEVTGTYNIYPTQAPVVPGLSEGGFTEPDPEVYALEVFYPSNQMNNHGANSMKGVKIASINFYPLQFNPSTGKLKLTTHIEFTLNYTDDQTDIIKHKRLLSYSYNNILTEIKEFVDNPEDVDDYLQPEIIDQYPDAFLPDEFPNFSGSPVKYVIITKGEDFVQKFEEIANWKTKTGVPTVVKTTDWIYTYYQGNDKPEKIRNFISDAYENWGTEYVLLGGDINLVPVRYAWSYPTFSMTLPDVYPKGAFIPTDIYYSCIDGSWNSDRDATFGEANWNRSNDGSFYEENNDEINLDQVDRIPDIYLGRIPVEDINELNNYLTKYFNYIKKSQGNENYVLLFSADSDQINSSQMETVASEFRHDIQQNSMTKLYEDDGFINEDVLNHMNANGTPNYNIILGFGHGGEYAFEACLGNIYKQEMIDLQNIDQSQFLWLLHCMTMAFDKDCIAEQFITTINGGVSLIGNTREGFNRDPSDYAKYFIYHRNNNFNKDISH